MRDTLAIATLMFWPVIPLFWIPVHRATGLFRRLGIFTYLMPGVTWVPVAYVVWKNKESLLTYAFELPFYVNIAGIVLLVFGTAMHLWTIKLLGGLGIIGVPEIILNVKNKVADKGPFSVVRHPTYLAHTLMFSGVFLITGTISVGVLAVLDFIAVNAVIIPLEEKELVARFGNDYIQYCSRVTGRFFPGLNSP